jgi:hypothetical protein
MNINDIFTEIEYTKERSAEELFKWVNLKEEELREWGWEHSGTKALRQIKHMALSKRLPNKFAHELTPFAYYANAYYGNKPEVRFKPCCGSEQYEGIVIDNRNKVFVEITNAIDGKAWGLQKELLVADGHSPWEHAILGVEGNRTKRTRSVSDIKISEDALPHSVIIDKIKKLVEKRVLEKCKKSLEQNLPYGQNKTILIVTFDDTIVRPSIRRNCWDDFIDFKRTEVDSMKHNFKKIILFGWLDKKFID